MKTTLFAALLVASSPLWAQYRPLETTDEARQRHNAQRYEEYRQRGYQAPLSGYATDLADPAPRGTERPGMRDPSAPQRRQHDGYAPRRY